VTEYRPSADDSMDRSPNIGVIIGGIIGALVLLALIALVLWKVRYSQNFAGCIARNFNQKKCIWWRQNAILYLKLKILQKTLSTKTDFCNSG